MSTRDRAPTPPPDDVLTLRAVASTWVYGIVTGLLLAAIVLPHRAPVTLRIFGITGFILLWVLTILGKLSRWMAPADQVLIGGPLSQAVGGPGWARATPANFVYLGSYSASFSIPLFVVSPDVRDRIPILWVFLVGGIAAMAAGWLAWLWHERSLRTLAIR